MLHRGRDGFSVYPDRNVVLGHCLFDTGCNGMFVDEAGYVISFDGRLDNRSDLAGILRDQDVDLPDFERMSDRSLLLLAYRSFGQALPQFLRGDFAIAIWDPVREELFLCRDHLGVRPLFYSRIDGEVHFASEIKVLRAMRGVRHFVVREEAIEGFVDGLLDTRAPARTFFREVFRILPGHCALISAEGMKIRQYWMLDPGHPIRRNNGPAMLRAALTKAIDRRLRTTLPVGALLSGGLDSSAIVSLIGARETSAIPASVKAYSMTFPDNSEDETAYIDAVIDAYGLDGEKIAASQATAFEAIDDVIGEQDHPPPAPNTCIFRHFLNAISARGDARVVLHGHGGDEVISRGTGLFAEMAESGRWVRLWQELGESTEVLGPRRNHFAGLVLRKGLRGWRGKVSSWVKPKRLLGRDVKRFAPDGRRRQSEQLLHLRDLTAPLFGHALEVIDHEAAAAGIEVRMPFLDVDLIALCVTIPAQDKWIAGYPRAALRRALSGILPAAVANRRDKFNFADHLRRSILRDHGELVDDSLNTKGGWIAPYANLTDLRAKWQSLIDDGTVDGRSLLQIWRAVALSRWLQLESTRRATAPITNLQAAE